VPGSVAEVVVFGSMLKPEVDRVSDVDLAVEIVPKESNPERARAINERRVLELELLGRGSRIGSCSGIGKRSAISRAGVA